MKEKVIYIVSFMLTFALVSGVFIYLNSIYKNIFVFDFTPVTQVQNPQANKIEQKAEKKTFPSKNEEPIKIDSPPKNIPDIKPNDAVTAKKDIVQAPKLTMPIAEQNKAEKEKLVQQTEVIKPSILEKESARKDSAYKAWLKQTVKLYESMDTQRAAKIIRGYSDNIARDILLSMKKKKAASILAEFKPEEAIRIISVN